MSRQFIKTDKSKKQGQRGAATSTLPAEKLWYKNPLQLMVVAVILIATYACFSPALTAKKQFTNWDDNGFITNQPLIRDLSAENIKTLFNPQVGVMGNYHPLTMLSYSLNYYFSKLAVKPYMQTNLLIHLLNTLLVFVFFYRLSRKKFWVGAVAALWFGIHPMHVESVAWISERKDVLYAFFFFLSCIAYLGYVDTGKRTGFLWAFVFFTLSCLSKAMAVPLPLVLLLIDFYRGRKINLKVAAEKIPFLIVALLAGINTVILQSHEGTIVEFHTFTVIQRILFASNGFMLYVWKLVVPLGLSAFYPYPVIEAGKSLPLTYILFPFIVLALVIIPLFILKRRSDKENFKVFVFGLGFFAVMIMPVLQFVTVGIAAMADRYSYVSYTGLFFITGTFIHDALQKKQIRAGVAVAAAGFSVFLMVNCYNRVSVWDNSETLWTDVINKHPFKEEYAGNINRITQEGIATAYKNRASYYREKGMLDKAFEDYSVVAKANPRDAGTFLNLGNLYALQKQFDKVLEMYSKAIEIDPLHSDGYANRGMTYSLLGRYPEALDDLNKALALAPNSTDVLEKMAHLQMKLQHYEETVSICSKLIEAGSGTANTFLFRGVSLAAMQKTNEATADLEQVVSMQPRHAYAWSHLMNLYYESQNYEAALNAAQEAASLGYPVDAAFLAELETKAK